MKVIISERRLVTEVEYAYYEVEVPDEIAKLYNSDDEDGWYDWVSENWWVHNEPYHYEHGDIVEVQTEDWEIDEVIKDE